MPVPANDEKFANLMFGLFTGVMLTASLYLFFIWIVMRDRGQVFLLLLLLCLGANVASTNDLLMNQLGLHGQTARDMLQNLQRHLFLHSSVSFLPTIFSSSTPTRRAFACLFTCWLRYLSPYLSMRPSA